MESFTEKELLETVNDMGCDLSSEELLLFKKEMDQFLDKIERENDQQSQDQTAFNSLVKNISHSATCDIPSSYNEGLFYVEQYGRFPSYESIAMRRSRGIVSPSSVSINRVHGEITVHDEILNILSDGYRCLQQITKDNNRLKDLNSRLERSLYRSRARSLSSDEDNFASAQTLNEHIDKVKRHNAVMAVDPAVRSVLHPPPGGVPFRHDPVKKYEMYKKGWMKNPPPGEKKRLSLRWKVREFMLRREIPGVKPIDLIRRRVSNPDWCPRPYLD